MVRMSLQRLFVTIALPFLVLTLAAPSPAQSCDPATDVHVDGGFRFFIDNTVRVTICNSGECAQDVGLAVYKKFGPDISNQVLFDSETATVAPGDCVELSVTLPDCMYQIDAFYGALITNFSTGDRYGTRLLLGQMGGDAICVGEGEGECTGCTFTQGYWKNHPDAWPTDSLALGSVVYTQEQLIAILNQPVRGNGLVSLAKQLIAAKLNQLNDACVPDDVQQAINDADALIGSLIVPPNPGAGYLAPSTTSALTSTLDTYNNGLTPGGPPHCD